MKVTIKRLAEYHDFSYTDLRDRVVRVSMYDDGGFVYIDGKMKKPSHTSEAVPGYHNEFNMKALMKYLTKNHQPIQKTK